MGQAPAAGAHDGDVAVGRRRGAAGKRSQSPAPVLGGAVPTAPGCSHFRTAASLAWPSVFVS